MGRKIVKLNNSDELMRLDKNENYNFLNKKVLEEIDKIDIKNISLYPEYSELLKELSSYTGQSQTSIYPTNGSDYGIEIILKKFVKRGDIALVVTPTFVTHIRVLLEIGAQIQCVDYVRDNGNFFFPLTKVLELLDKKPRCLVLCNPNNPTGSIIHKKDIELIVDKAEKLGTMVLIDEAYFEFFGETAVMLLNKYRNLIVTRSFSKSFGIAGARLGYILSNEDTIKSLKANQRPWNVSALASHTGIIVLKNKDLFSRKIKKILDAKKQLVSLLKKLNYDVYDTNTNFLTIRTLNSNKVVDMFRKEGILISDLSDYLGDPNKLLNNFIRITVPIGFDLNKVKSIIIKVTKKLLKDFFHTE